MKHILAFFVIFLSLTARAQYNIPVAPANIEQQPKRDSIVVTQAPRLNMQLYNEAYDKYLRDLQFKQRNKIIFKNTGLTLTQAALDNWAAGGSNSFSTRITVHIEHHYTAPVFNIKTIFDAAASMMVTEGRFVKSEDYWNINVKPNWKIGRKWELSGDLLIKSQFASTFKYISENESNLLSSFMSPGEFILSAGVTYAPPKKKISIYLAPVSGNLFMVLNKELSDAGAFGMEPGQMFKPKIGALLRVIYNEKFLKDKIEFWTKLESFWNYDSDPTIWWENKLGFKFTNLFSANLYFLAKYNRDEQTPRMKEGGTDFWDVWQLNESFGLSLMFNFESKTPKQIETQWAKPLATRKKRR